MRRGQGKLTKDLTKGKRAPQSVKSFPIGTKTAGPDLNRRLWSGEGGEEKKLWTRPILEDTRKRGLT